VTAMVNLCNSNFYTYIYIHIERSEFRDRNEVVANHLMVGNQKCVDGGQKVGATAIYISSEMGYENEVHINGAGEVDRIYVKGTGGREINKESNLYEQSFNQPLAYNYAMLVSAEHQLPIRVLVKEKEKIVYYGLWYVNKCEYKLMNGFMCWEFLLCREPADKQI
jgi:hypothetical protein